MAEHQDALLGGEFAAYRNLLLPAVDPAGPNAVRLTVRRRRRRRVATVAAVVVLAIAVPVAGWAAAGRNARPAPAGTATPSPATTDPASPTPGVPSPSATPSGTPSAPDGRISRTELLAAPLDLPAWRPGPGCLARDVRLRATVRDDGDVVVATVGYGDVDSDGATETVVLLRCVLGTGGPAQVVAFDRDAAGRIVAMGRVVRTDLGKPQWLADLAVRDDGAIRVQVADYAPGGGWSIEQSIMQWRTYRWTGDAFRQVAGPTSFPPNPAAAPPSTPSTSPTPLAMRVTATKLVYGPPDADGWRMGEITITVVNDGPTRIDDPMVSYVVNSRDSLDHASMDGCPTAIGGNGRISCFPPPLDPGQRDTIRFPFRTRSNGPDGQLTLVAERGDSSTGAAVPGTATTVSVPVVIGG